MKNKKWCFSKKCVYCINNCSFINTCLFRVDNVDLQERKGNFLQYFWFSIFCWLILNLWLKIGTQKRKKGGYSNIVWLKLNECVISTDCCFINCCLFIVDREVLESWYSKLLKLFEYILNILLLIEFFNMIPNNNWMNLLLVLLCSSVRQTNRNFKKYDTLMYCSSMFSHTKNEISWKVNLQTKKRWGSYLRACPQ